MMSQGNKTKRAARMGKRVDVGRIKRERGNQSKGVSFFTKFVRRKSGTDGYLFIL